MVNIPVTLYASSWWGREAVNTNIIVICLTWQWTYHTQDKYVDHYTIDAIKYEEK
jgi:hypothetical protein